MILGSGPRLKRRHGATYEVASVLVRAIVDPLGPLLSNVVKTKKDTRPNSSHLLISDELISRWICTKFIAIADTVLI